MICRYLGRLLIYVGAKCLGNENGIGIGIYQSKWQFWLLALCMDTKLPGDMRRKLVRFSR